MERIKLLGALMTLAFSSVAGAQDYDAMLKRATFSLSEAITSAMKDAKQGVVFEAELEQEHGRTLYSIDISQGNKALNIVLDATDGSVFERETESVDLSKLVRTAKVPLVDAIRTALGKAAGNAVHARLAMKGGTPEARVLVAGGGKLTLVVVNAVTGEVTSTDAQGPSAPDADELDERFTATFGEDRSDLGPIGKNPFFILEPGWFIELAGKKGDDDVEISIRVLDVTKRIDGVETRAVEEKEIVNGQVKESTRDYFAISKRTNNVYYFGEDVDVYKDGKVVGHEGAWLAGVDGARYGLFMPGVPLLGARFYQEIAPGVAMDRGEVASLTATLDCPAGKFARTHQRRPSATRSRRATP